jgi:hypothetical protein
MTLIQMVDRGLHLLRKAVEKPHPGSHRPGRAIFLLSSSLI